MPNTRDIILGAKSFTLLKGEPKTGKTIAGASYPAPMYIFDNDGRMEPIKRFFPNKDIDYDFYDNSMAVMRKLEELRNHCPYETVFYDGITRGCSTALTTILGMRKTEANAQANSGSENVQRLKARKVRVVGGMEKLDVDDYGGEMRYIINVLDHLLALYMQDGLPNHVLCSAHIISTESTDIKTKTVTKTRSIITAGKKPAAIVPTYFNEVYHTASIIGDLAGSGNLSRPKHIAITENFGDDWAATALKLPISIDFTNKSLFDVIQWYVQNPGEVDKLERNLDYDSNKETED